MIDEDIQAHLCGNLYTFQSLLVSLGKGLYHPSNDRAVSNTDRCAFKSSSFTLKSLEKQFKEKKAAENWSVLN